MLRRTRTGACRWWPKLRARNRRASGRSSPSGSVSFTNRAARGRSRRARGSGSRRGPRIGPAIPSRSRRTRPALAWLTHQRLRVRKCGTRRDVDAPVGPAPAQDRKVQHQYTPSTTRLEPRERPHVPHAVPRIESRRGLALRLVALEEARHEELLRQRRQPHAARLAVADDALGIVGIDDLDHGARRGRVVDDVPVVVGPRARLVAGQAHERVPVGGGEVRAVEQLLHREAVELRRHLRAAAEDARDPELLERDLLAERLEQLRRREQAADASWALQQGQGLVDHVLLVRSIIGHLAHLDELDDPARVEVHHEADAAAVLREVLDGEAQPARTRGPDVSQSAPLGKNSSGSVSLNTS